MSDVLAWLAERYPDADPTSLRVVKYFIESRKPGEPLFYQEANMPGNRRIQEMARAYLEEHSGA